MVSQFENPQRTQLKEVIKACTCTTLGHIASKLYNGLPAAGRDMDSANDLDMVLRDGVGRDEPAGIGSRAILQALLKVEEVDQGRTITNKQEAHIDKFVNRSANMLHESTNRDQIPCIGLVSRGGLASPTGITRPLRGESTNTDKRSISQHKRL